jgi:hypothetical protein
MSRPVDCVSGQQHFPGIENRKYQEFIVFYTGGPELRSLRGVPAAGFHRARRIYQNYTETNPAFVVTIHIKQITKLGRPSPEAPNLFL